MLRSIILLVFLAATSLPAAPNIVFVFIDDMGYGDLSSYGNRDIKTANIDRLAAEGIKFEQFYVGSPICSPSRVAITTGQYPARHLINSYLNSRERNRAPRHERFSRPSRAHRCENFSAGWLCDGALRQMAYGWRPRRG